MSRRRALPGADELFRATGGPAPAAARESAEPSAATALATVTDLAPTAEEPAPARTPARAPVKRRTRASDRRPTGRERHDEKITVYVSAEELLDLEHARLTLRADHGLAVDRGRIVREALAVVLADLDAEGEQSTLVRRLRGR